MLRCTKPLRPSIFVFRSPGGHGNANESLDRFSIVRLGPTESYAPRIDGVLALSERARDATLLRSDSRSSAKWSVPASSDLVEMSDEKHPASKSFPLADPSHTSIPTRVGLCLSSARSADE